MCCARILLVIGWFLLLPPFASKDRIDEKRPLKEWDHDSSFDTAKECEDFRNRMSSKYDQEGKKYMRNGCYSLDVFLPISIRSF